MQDAHQLYTIGEGRRHDHGESQAMRLRKTCRCTEVLRRRPSPIACHARPALARRPALQGIKNMPYERKVRRGPKPGVSVVTFGPNDLAFNMEGHAGYPFTSVADCMRNVTAQLDGTGIRLAMGTGTKPEQREKYLGLGSRCFRKMRPHRR